MDPSSTIQEFLRGDGAQWIAAQKLLHPKPEGMDDEVYAFERLTATLEEQKQQERLQQQSGAGFHGPQPSSAYSVVPYPASQHLQNANLAYDPFSGMSANQSAVSPDSFYNPYNPLPYEASSQYDTHSPPLPGAPYPSHHSSHSPYQQDLRVPSPYESISGPSTGPYAALAGSSTSYGQVGQSQDTYAAYNGMDYGVADPQIEWMDYSTHDADLEAEQGQQEGVIDPSLLSASASNAAPFTPHMPQQMSVSPTLLHPHPQSHAINSSALLSPMTAAANGSSYDHLPTPSAISQVASASGKRPSQGSRSTSKTLSSGYGHLLQPDKLERIPAETAAILITFLTNEYSESVDTQARKEILQALRDNAPSKFFEAWAEKPEGIEILKTWLKEGITDKSKADTLMPLLHVIDRLPLTLDNLRESKMGKPILRLVKDPPSTAVKDMASKLEQRWREMMASTPSESGQPASNESKKRQSPAIELADARKKRKVVEIPFVRVPIPVKKTAGPSAKPVAKLAKPTAPPPTVKDAKADSSFFSTTKPKPKLPSFRKPAPEPVKKEPTPSEMPNTAQPGNVDPFQEALRSMNKRNNAADKSTPPVEVKLDPKMEVDEVDEKKKMKKRKSVSFAPADALEKIKLIDPAVYDDDDETEHQHFNLRDLDRQEGYAWRHLAFDEQIDWFEPLYIELPDSIETFERGNSSQEKTTQEERERIAVASYYASPTLIPDSPAEIEHTLPEVHDESYLKMIRLSSDMEVVTPEEDISDDQAKVTELLKKINGGGNTSMASASVSAAEYGIDLNALVDLGRILGRPNPLQPTAPAGQEAMLQQPFGGIPGGDWQDAGWAGDYEDGSSGGGYRRSRGTGGFRPEMDQGWSGRARGRGRGRGARGGDRRPHEKRPRNIPCDYYKNGRCKYGDDCDYLHLDSFA